MKAFCSVVVALPLAGALAAPAMAANDIDALRQQLAEQRALIQAQQQQLERQAQTLDRLNRRLNDMAASPPVAPPATAEMSKATAPAAVQAGSQMPEAEPRDGVGDLNNESVRAGVFPGAFKIPGSRDISLAIGGFVKAAAIVDSHAEAMGADFVPALLGTKRGDTDGASSIDSTLTKLFIDARAPARVGSLRGYVEWDFNKANDGNMDLKLRHAYGNWHTPAGTLVVGYTWSTLMDLKILPEGLTEPTVSGPIFSRQPQIRWTQPLSSTFTLHAAVEDPSSSDIFDPDNTPELGNTRLPDGVLGLEYERKGVGHWRLNGILRDIRVSLPANITDRELGWGLTLSGHLELAGRDRWVLSGAYGEGLGRYLLGIQPSAGSVIDVANNTLALRENWGLMTAYQHHWSESLRSTAMFGHAQAKSLSFQPGNTFESSSYGAVNLMWSVLPYLTLGVEYGYGQRKNKDGSGLDNHRIALGVQVF